MPRSLWLVWQVAWKIFKGFSSRAEVILGLVVVSKVRLGTAF